jgi:hypothetical protein
MMLIEETESTPRKPCRNANLSTKNSTRTDLDLDTCSHVVSLDVFTVIIFAKLHKLCNCLLSDCNLSFAYFTLWLPDACTLGEHTVNGVTLNVLT